MPTDVPELLTAGRPERYAGEPVSARSRRRVSLPGPLRALSVAAAALAAVAAVAAVTSRPAPARAPAPPVAVETPSPDTPISPAVLAALLATRAQSLPRQSGVLLAAGGRPSAAAARAAAASLVGRQCIPVEGSDLTVLSSGGRWQEAEVFVNPPQTAPFIFYLTWTGRGYSYRYPQIPDACP